MRKQFVEVSNFKGLVGNMIALKYREMPGNLGMSLSARRECMETHHT